MGFFSSRSIDDKRGWPNVKEWVHAGILLSPRLVSSDFKAALQAEALKVCFRRHSEDSHSLWAIITPDHVERVPLRIICDPGVWTKGVRAHHPRRDFPIAVEISRHPAIVSPGGRGVGPAQDSLRKIWSWDMLPQPHIGEELGHLSGSPSPQINTPGRPGIERRATVVTETTHTGTCEYSNL
jgi:hypothetical protein